MENKVVAKVNGVVSIEECVSKKGNAYKAVFVTVNGRKIQVGFLNAFMEAYFMIAGIKTE